MHFNRLYFYAAGQDYLDLVEQVEKLRLYVLPPEPGRGETDLRLPYGSKREDFDGNSRLRYLSLKPMKEVRQDIGGGFTEATYDVVSWARGYIYKDRQLVGHMIHQTLPRFDRPNPTEDHVEEFEDARALRKVMSQLRRWMKKNWVDHYGMEGFLVLKL